MTHTDNSQNMSSEQIKQVLTNLISKTAQKTTAEGKYDRTILAKIQYCTDATIGQYKIQYQNGYYTAYALDKTKRYSDGASVYVTVPENDLSNRLFIQDLASNDNSQRTYLTNLEGDQQFSTIGQNLIKPYTTEFGLSSHWDMPQGREVFYYIDGKTNNQLALITLGEVLTNIQSGDGYFRLGAKFKTNIDDDRKVSGNYGLRTVLIFKRQREDGLYEEYPLTYQIDTFSMAGSPFEFNEYSERYNYFEIDKENFVRVQSISGFVYGFPESSVRPEPIDIWIKDITLHSGIKLYEATVDNTFNVNIATPEGICFNLPAEGEDEITHLRLEGEFSINGVIVSSQDQEVEYFWAKKNLNIDSTGNAKYLSYFGKGWQCLNEGHKTRATDDEISSLQNYTVTSDEQPPGYVGVVKWNSAQTINLPKEQCKGRATVIKCCVRYENNTYFSRELTIINTTGYYLLLDPGEDQKFYAGSGETTITAGVFQTQPTQTSYAETPVPAMFQPVSNIVYKWEIQNNNSITSLSSQIGGDMLPSEPDWTSSNSSLTYSDTPSATDAQVEVYLTELAEATHIDKILLENCYQRWQYYTHFYQTYDGEQTDSEYITAKTRADAILTGWKQQLDKYYTESFENPSSLYVLGPSKVYPKWTISPEELQQLYVNREDPFSYAAVDHVEHIYNNGSTVYSNYQQNTLYKVQASKIVGEMVISVTASLVENIDGDIIYSPLETKEIRLVNQVGNGLDYDLQIENGTQNFMYSTAGNKPDVSIKPLTFKLFSKEDGSLVFDSSKIDNGEVIIENLKPQWKFYVDKTLLVSKYLGSDSSICAPDPTVLNRYIVYKQPIFYYDIAKTYNVNYKERSNIELSIEYEGATYTAETNFTFSKQGDLGTNGTDLYLSIEDPVYEQYRSDVLAMDMYSQFNYNNGQNTEIKESFYPDERHLGSTYLYATHIYANNGGQWLEQEGFDDGDFCNLQIAQNAYESPTIEDPSDPMHLLLHSRDVTTTLYGYWFEDGQKNLVDIDSEWGSASGTTQELRDQTKLGRSRVYDRASFTLSPITGSSTLLTLEPPAKYGDQYTYFYKPMEVLYDASDGNKYEWTAYNVVQCTAKHIIREQINPQTGEPIERTNYGYYKIPFFYYGFYQRQNGGAYVNMTPEGLDPARHFPVYGGYDEVIYGADGLDPQYNKQTPFTFRLFDEHGVDITDEALASSNTYIEWNNSYGLQSLPYVNNIPAYSSYTAKQSLYHKYCTYNGQTYYCIQNHTPDQKLEVKDYSGRVIKTYNENGTAPYDFVTPYWEKVSPHIAKNTRMFTPPPTYEACAADALFSSWVSVKVTYIKGDKKYEAAALLPINILMNVYGSDEINGWDGKKTVVDDGYIISNKVAAGYKTKDNAFVGITIGTKMITNGYESTASSEDQIECGLFGYGKYTDSNLPAGRVGYGQTLFLDAKTGLAAFGPRGSTQIILNPRIPKDGTTEESWSRLAGWYFSNNYLYKPLFADDLYNGSGSAIDTATGEIIATEGRGNDYYNTTPPDADGAVIPGSVGFYVPGRDTGTLTPDTVLMWASAAGMRSVDFNDDGSFDSLASIVRSIQNKFTQSDFPYYYATTTPIEVDIEPQISKSTFLDNINELSTTYSDDTALLGYISSYNTAFSNFERAIADNYDELLPALRQATLDVQDLVDSVSFPVVYRDGAPVKPDLSTPLTIVNVDELQKWYLDSNEDYVTLQSTELANLSTGLAEYDRLRNELVNNPQQVEDVEYTLQDLRDIVSIIKQHFLNNYPVKRKKNKSDWNTSSAIMPIVAADRVTITNISVLQNDYARAAYTATEDMQQYISDLITLFTSYNNLHAAYETWKADWDATSGKPIGYLSSNADKKEANFSLTYGGALHCIKADIEGKLTALSGSIGKGNGKLDICVNKFINNQNKYCLLYNKAFRVTYDDQAQGRDCEVFVDGEIVARSGRIGNTADNVDGTDKHTLFMEYYWYPRKLPDSHLRWGDDPSSSTYREAQWDTTQGAIVKYSLCHPHFSVIDDPNGAVNKDSQGGTEFSYKAGDACILGRVYATGGRMGDWIIDNEVLRDPYSTIILKPVLQPGESYRDNGYINCSQTTIFGDGKVYGACQGNPLSPNLNTANPIWYIKSDGEAHFTNYNSTYKGKSFQTSASGGTVVNSNGVTIGSASMTASGSSMSFNGGASFSGDVSITGATSISGAVTGTSFTAGQSALSSGYLDIGSGVGIRPSGASLPQTNFTGDVSIGANSISAVSNITSSGTIYTTGTVIASDYKIGNQSLENYIKAVVRDYLSNIRVAIGGATGTQSGVGSTHTHSGTSLTAMLINDN